MAQAYGYTLDGLFVQEDRVWLDRLSDFVPRLPPGAPRPGETYYLLHVRRASLSFADIWGKTKWAGDYRPQYERRVLHELSDEGVALYSGWNTPVVNTPGEWNSFLYHAKIGRMRELIVSEACIRACIPYVMREHAVRRDALCACGPQDVILLGDYGGRSDVFPIPPERRRRR